MGWGEARGEAVPNMMVVGPRGRALVIRCDPMHEPPVESLAALAKASGLLVLVLDHAVGLESVDDGQMNAAGWFRA